MIHGLVRAKDGRKFSKSLNNGVDPLEMVEKFGADALRMGLLVGTAIGNDAKFDENKVKGYKHFANKIWNGSRFVLQNLEGFDYKKEPKFTKKHKENLKELDETVAEVTELLEKFRVDLAADTAYHYFWHTFADVIIEENKDILLDEDKEAKASAQWTLYTILTTSLKMLHPFMPFVTEAVWSHLEIGAHKSEEFLMIESWPESK